MTTTEVDNWPGDVEGLQGPALMERMRRHAERFATQIVNDHIHTVDLGKRPFELQGRLGHLHRRCADHRHRRHREVPRPAVRGEIPRPRRFGLRHLRWLLLPQPARRRGRRRQHRGRRSAVSLAHRRARHAGPPARQAARREDPAGPPVRASRTRARCQLVWNHTVDEVLGDRHGVSRRAPARRCRTASTRDIAVTGLFIAIGHSPNTEIFAGQLDMRERLHPDSRAASRANATATSVPGVFAAGDVADHVYRQAITSAGAGCMAALDADKYLEGLDADH